MSRITRISCLLAAALVPLACTTTTETPSGAASGRPVIKFEGDPGSWEPGGPSASHQAAFGAGESARYLSDGIFRIDLADVPAATDLPDISNLRLSHRRSRMPNPLSEAENDALRAAAQNLPPSPQIQSSSLPSAQAPLTAGASFDSLDSNDCCGGAFTTVPPDPELAVGPNHIIAVANVAFAIYDKSGTLLSGPTTFEAFFAGTPNCTGVFDPNAIYDEKEDRFIIGIDADGTGYCVAATQTGNPLGGWNQTRFGTGSDFFDYPHAGVGEDAIYMGANIFAGSFLEGRVYAIDKAALYAGLPVTVVTRSTGSEGTPQPMNLHGWAQGTWPASGPHYILTDATFGNGDQYGVWSWSDPFGADVLVDEGTVNLFAAIGISAGFPVASPQLGGQTLEGNDWRVQDAEYRNGHIWMSTTVACNPGGGTVNCVRWAQIDPTGPSVGEAGIWGTNGQFRTFADVAADHCDNMAIGYTRSSSSSFPGVYVAGREATDPSGTLQPENLVKAGEETYYDWLPQPQRWGDYSGMTIDPDGSTFWYLGEYAKTVNNGSANWGLYIGSFSFGCTDDPPANPPGQASNPSPADNAIEVLVNANLSWTAGADTETHDVYLGTSSPLGPGDLVSDGQSGTSFDPGTLAFAQEYFWRVDENNSFNGGSTTTGAEWSFTTEAEPDAVHVAAIDGWGEAGRGNRWNATARVTVEDQDLNRVSGVTVSADWSNGTNGSGTCSTDGNGQCTITKNNIRNTNDVTFTVTDLAATGFVYDAGANVVTSININRNDPPPPPGNQAPTASFTFDCTVRTCDFDASGSNDPDGSISGYSWDFGDGFGGSGVAPSHTYAADGTYSVVLTVTDNEGATGNDSNDVTVPPPVSGGQMWVTAIVVDTLSLGGGNKSPRAFVTIEDDVGNPVGTATVTGDFDPSDAGSEFGVTGVTNGSGTATVTGSNTKKGKLKFTFCVTDVTKAGLTYNPSGNTLTCQNL